MESRKQVPCAAHTSQLVLTDISHTTAEDNTCTWATAGHTLGILNKRHCLHQYTWILNTVLTLYGDSMIII